MKQEVGDLAKKQHDPYDPEAIVPSDESSKAFVRALVERGEAVVPPPDGKLPPGATHVIIGTTPEGLAIVKRVRFSAF